MSANQDIITALQNFYNSNKNSFTNTYALEHNTDFGTQIYQKQYYGVQSIPKIISSYQASGDLASLKTALNQNDLSVSALNAETQSISQTLAQADPGFRLFGPTQLFTSSNSGIQAINTAIQNAQTVPRTVNPSVSSPVTNSLTSALSSLSANSTVKSVNSALSGISPVFLIGGVVVLFLLLRK